MFTKNLLIFEISVETRIQSQILNACFPFRMPVSSISFTEMNSKTDAIGTVF